jgi:hypothetical protein
VVTHPKEALTPGQKMYVYEKKLTYALKFSWNWRFIPTSDVCTEADMDMRSSPFWDTTQNSRMARSHLHHDRILKS